MKRSKFSEEQIVYAIRQAAWYRRSRAKDQSALRMCIRNLAHDPQKLKPRAGVAQPRFRPVRRSVGV